MHSPRGSRSPVPVASLGSTNFAKHRYKSFDNARARAWPWASMYIQRGKGGGRGSTRAGQVQGDARIEERAEDAVHAVGGGGRRECTGKGKRERILPRWKFGDTPSARSRATLAKRVVALSRCHSRCSRASFGRPNVSDDVADIANCKNHHRENTARPSVHPPARDTLAPDFLTPGGGGGGGHPTIRNSTFAAAAVI